MENVQKCPINPLASRTHGVNNTHHQRGTSVTADAPRPTRLGPMKSS